MPRVASEASVPLPPFPGAASTRRPTDAAEPSTPFAALLDDADGAAPERPERPQPTSATVAADDAAAKDEARREREVERIASVLVAEAIIIPVNATTAGDAAMAVDAETVQSALATAVAEIAQPAPADAVDPDPHEIETEAAAVEGNTAMFEPQPIGAPTPPPATAVAAAAAAVPATPITRAEPEEVAEAGPASAEAGLPLRPRAGTAEGGQQPIRHDPTERGADAGSGKPSRGSGNAAPPRAEAAGNEEPEPADPVEAEPGAEPGAEPDAGPDTGPAGKSGHAHAHSSRAGGDAEQRLAHGARAPIEPQIGNTADKPSAEVVQLATLQQPAERAAGASLVASAGSEAPPIDGAAVPIAGLALEIAARALSGRSRFEIRLDPPELGRIDVRVDLDRSGQVTSRLVVEKAETLDLLRRDAPELERALQQAGLKTGDNGLQFALRDQSGQGQDPGDGSRSDAMRLVVPDPEPTSIETAPLGYGRSLRLGTGIDIRV